MSHKNIILQTQRLGDLIMTFPLCKWLVEQDNRDVWLVGEEMFFKELLKFSPKKVFYVPFEAEEALLKESFHSLINLSHRPESAVLAGKINTKSTLGTYNKDNIVHVKGFWHLYRLSLTHNNHYNRFHWAELNALDAIPLESIQKTKYPALKKLRKGRIGLFVGASEKAKRPDAPFWAELALALAKKGYQPVFLGGSKEEQKLAQHAANLAKMPRASLAGRFTLLELIVFLQTLDLLITPDTGPMHLAANEAIPTLNLSLGPVHPFETAPYQPNHFILRSSVSCSGCWQCSKKTQLCRKAFVPNRIANLIHAYLQEKTLPQLPELSLYKTARTKEGFYHLEHLFGEKPYYDMQGEFWRYFFLHHYFKEQNISLFEEPLVQASQSLFQSLPKIHHTLRSQHTNIIRKRILQTKTKTLFQENDWRHYPPIMRPLTSFIQLLLENENYSSVAHTKTMKILEDFAQYTK